MTTTTIDGIPTTQAPPVALRPVPLPDASRCSYSFANGKRCRFPASHAGFCTRHLRFGIPQPPNDSTDLSADLLPGGLSEFSSAEDIRQFLARLLALVTKGRISPRRAAVLAFITNQLLHSHRAIQKEADAQSTQILFDVPRPELD